MTLRDAAWSLAQHTPERAISQILASLRAATPLDAAAVLVLDEGGSLRIVDQLGLSPAARAVCFHPADHQRLRLSLSAKGALRFTDSTEGDPYDGLLLGGARVPEIHACQAIPLRIGDRTVGLLTTDALDPHGLDGLSAEDLALGAALLSTALRHDRLRDELLRAPAGTAEQAGPIRRAGSRPVPKEGAATDLWRSRSPAIYALCQQIELLAPLPLPVLVLGETGVGKDLVARALHDRSLRAAAPLVAVNCAALPQALLLAELFGHTRGAFTGATAARPGRFAAAAGSTLFLDEIGELAPEAQAALLRVLQERVVQRLGEDHERAVDARVVAATHRDLPREVEAGRFRADLYHRLAVFPLRVPALRERLVDLGALVADFGATCAGQLGLRLEPIAPALVQQLCRRPWPGNVRELRHATERAVLRGLLRLRAGGGGAALGLREEDFDPDPAPPVFAPAAPPGGEGPPPALLAAGAPQIADLPLSLALDEARRQSLGEALSQCGGNVAQAARRLGISRSFAYKELARLGLHRR